MSGVNEFLGLSSESLRAFCIAGDFSFYDGVLLDEVFDAREMLAIVI